MTKYYIGKNSERVFAVYRATYDGKLLMSEEQWSIPAGKSWGPTRRVSEWYFIGNDNVWESTANEVATYLPKDALSK